MKIYRQDGTEVPWDFNQFPDGQVQLKILQSLVSLNESYNVHVSLPNTVILDLFNQFLYDFDVPNVTINYLYGARSDKNTSGDYYVSEVPNRIFSELYASRGYDINVKFLAPHCDNLIQNKTYFSYTFNLPSCVNLKDYDLVIFPDESAYRRYASQLSDSEFLVSEFLVCQKERDQVTGQIVSHKIPDLPDYVKKVIVVDDLCDGGFTFISLAQSLPPQVEKHLFVFHGVFSNNGLEKVCDEYSKVFVSNSLPNYQDSFELIPNFSDRVVVFDVWGQS